MPYIHDDTEDSTMEPIAIVGMACRLPGSVDSASKLWDLLVKKGSTQTPKVPANRFNIDAHFHEDLERPGSFNVAGGYFLDGNLEDFDPTFFGITPVEAMWMDPQQRKILEVCYECLESAGLTLDTVSGTDTAVFVGSFTSDYQQMSIREPDFRHNYAATGVDPGIISNRIGNTFNLKGPSSSIYAIHNACNALRAHDCRAAITGGVNLILTVDQHMNTAKLGILSPTSTCHTFDKSADGYGRAEGAGALYLKRLGDAIRDGDPIRAVIRSSAVNTNGKVAGMGITHPSVEGQERVVRMAYERSGLIHDKTAYLECHGTGTPVGDPIEARAVANAMNDTRSREKPLLIGAVKANIGHSEAASGIFAVMKVAMATENGIIPGVAGLQDLNPQIDEKTWNVKVQKDTAPWPEGFKSRRAGVSSFGYGGTNGHVIVEDVNSVLPYYRHGKPMAEAKYDNRASRPFMVSFSAHDKVTLQRNIVAHAKVAHEYYLADLAFTLNTKRSKFPQRAFTIARQESQDRDFDVASFQFVSVAKKVRSDLAFVFTGQGAQWAGMAVEAMATFPSFLQSIRNLDGVLQRLDPPAAWSLESILHTPAMSNPINDAEIAQPICTAVQIAITDLLARWKIYPTLTVGHSSGELGAAYAAGLLSAPEALIAAFYRGYAVKHHAPSGAMLAVGLGVREMFEYLGNPEDPVVACENSPNSVTLSGTLEAIKELKSRLDNVGVFARELKTGKAYHSPQMASVAPEYNSLLSKAMSNVLDDKDRKWRRPKARMISSVTGEELYVDRIPDDYWSENLRCRVLFDSALSVLLEEHSTGNLGTIIEIGPHSALAGPLKQKFSAEEITEIAYIPTLVRNSDSAVQLLKTAGELFVRGYPLDVEEVNVMDELDHNASTNVVRKPLQLVDLPPYQWNYEKKYWAEARFSQEQRRLQFPRHDLLGSKITGLSDHSLVWRNVLSHRNIPWLKDHSLGNEAVFPAAAHLSLAIEALRQIGEVHGIKIEGVTLRDVAIRQALTIPDTDDGVEIQFRLHESSRSSALTVWYSFAVESISDGRWTIHCEGLITPNDGLQRNTSSPVDVSKLSKRVTGKRWYDAFNRVGFQYERSFQPLSQIRTNRKYHHAAASVQINVDSGLMQAESRYILHPSTIDACLQLIIISIMAGDHKGMSHGVVPINLEEVSLWFPVAEAGSNGRAVAWTDELNGRYFDTHTKMFTESGQLVLDVKNLRCVAYEAAVPQQVSEKKAREPYSQVAWKPDIKTLTTEQITRAYPNIHSLGDFLATILDLINHKSNLVRVLFIEVPATGILENCIQGLAPSTAITVGCSVNEKLESVKAIDPRITVIDTSTSQFTWSQTGIQDQDLIIVPEQAAQRKSEDPSLLEVVNSLVSKTGDVIVCSDVDTIAQGLTTRGFTIAMQTNIAHSNISLLSQASGGDSATHDWEKVSVFASPQSPPILRTFIQHLELQGRSAKVKTLSDFDDDDTKIILFDIDGTLLSHLNADNWDAVKRVLCSDRPIIWMTMGVIEGKSVFGGMTPCFIRALRSEQAASKILFVDMDAKDSMESAATYVQSKLGHIVTKDSGQDTEFYLRDGVGYVSRIIPNARLNAQFEAGEDPVTLDLLPADVPLGGKLGNGELILSQNGNLDGGLAPDHIELQVTHSSFDKKGLPSKLLKPVVGKIRRVGDNVSRALLGQNAVTYTMEAYSTIVQVPATLCATYEDLEASQLITTLPGLCDVVNAIVTAAKIRKHEHLLLLPAPAPIVDAVMFLSSVLGFTVTSVAASEKNKIERPSKLKLPDDTSLSEMSTVVLAHDFSTIGQEAWRSMPPLGRFVLLDTKISQAPDALPLTRGATFISTSTDVLYKQDQDTLGDVLRLSLHLMETHKNSVVVDAPVFDAGSLHDAPDAGIMFLDYDKSRVKIILKPAFSLSRSNVPLKAAHVIGFLTESGASVRVFRADASNEQDVKAVVADISDAKPIRGVVHAAMDGIYEQLTLDKWEASVAPKIKGALSLHNALKDTPLDFFVMTSSISAVLGNPGQSNYCAGNGFLDALAWHRNVNGLAASSLALPMVLDVGVVAENEDIEDSLSRKGMYGIDEQEMLRGFETAMRQEALRRPESASMGDAQIILGLETAYVATAIESGDTNDAYWYNDARLNAVRSVVELSNKNPGRGRGGSGFIDILNEAAAGSATEAISIISEHIMKRCSRILMTPVEDFEVDGPSVADYGLDSMIGAELRNWLFKEFGLDIPFQQLLAPTLTFKTLSMAVGEKLGLVQGKEQ
ncbi:MAG: hypothetical protein Q9196_001134 [Gyalolechia fulgens]